MRFCMTCVERYCPAYVTKTVHGVRNTEKFQCPEMHTWNKRLHTVVTLSLRLSCKLLNVLRKISSRTMKSDGKHRVTLEIHVYACEYYQKPRELNPLSGYLSIPQLSSLNTDQPIYSATSVANNRFSSEPSSAASLKPNGKCLCKHPTVLPKV